MDFETAARHCEAALLQDPSIHDCAVLLRSSESDPQLIACVVPAGPVAVEAVHARLAQALGDSPLPAAYLPVSSLPLTPDGATDSAALAELAVLDADLQRRWEDLLSAEGGVAGAAVEIEHHRPPRGVVHVLDLLPQGDGSAASTDGSAASTDGSAASTDGSAASTEEGPATAEGCAAAAERSAADAAADAGASPRQERRGQPASAAEAGDRPVDRPAISHGADLIELPGAPAVLADTLKRAAGTRGEAGIVHLQTDGSEVRQSYGELLEEAQCTLAGLRARGLQPGQAVLLQLDNSADFLPAYWGCVLGGMIPVPVSVAPVYQAEHPGVQKLLNAWRLLDEAAVLASGEVATALRALPIERFAVHDLAELREHPADRHWHSAAPDDPAMMLLTSGSTGLPKAVVLSHRNLIARSTASVQVNGFSPAEVSLNWMPLDHVAGIVYFHLRDVWVGCRQIHVVSDAILQDPLRWLDFIERFGVTVTFAPNFAFGLINEHAAEVQRRTWNLSSMRFMLNGGEAIVPRTARRFLQLLAPHGLAPTCLVPAWGMSEVSSGVTYSRTFTLQSTGDDDAHVEVGPPIPGVSLRIVGEQNRVLSEGEIGQLQVTGVTLMSGYHHNPELNREVFTADRWFATGDLAYLRDGRLTVTGRDKDEIIINGVNYVGAEIESVVEELQGVVVSFTAACRVRPPGSDTDRLAIFFSPASADPQQRAALLPAIRARVGAQVGVSPTYLIPLASSQVPKTAIGKIQRSQLKAQFERGEFSDTLKQVDMLSGSANTMPDWFYRRCWRPRPPGPRSDPPASATTLVFNDRLGIGEALCRELPAGSVIQVEAGAAFSRRSAGHLVIDPCEPGDYRRILEGINEPLARVIHLWGCREPDEAADGQNIPNHDHDPVTLSLLSLVQALGDARCRADRVDLLVVTRATQAVEPADSPDCRNGALGGLMRSADQELVWLHSRLLDVPHVDPAISARCIIQEMHHPWRDREVAYRDGRRLVCRLQQVDLPALPAQDLPLTRGGLYLLAGGLGGIGAGIARYLRDAWDARLLILGRTVLPERGDWEERGAAGDAVGRRMHALLDLQQDGAAVAYHAADLCDLRQVEAAVARAERDWQTPLRGIIHLAQAFHEAPLTEESPQRLSAALAAKSRGAWVCHHLLQARGGGLFVGFGSVNGTFGGAGVGAYAAASSYLSSFSHWQNRNSEVQSYNLEWSMWDDVGLSRGYALKDLSRSQGFEVIDPDLGRTALLAALVRDQRHLLIGLDGANPNVSRYAEGRAQPLSKLCAYGVPREQAASDQFDGLRVPDRFGTPTRIEWVAVAGQPDGQVPDRAAMVAEGRRQRTGRGVAVEPGTPTEQRVARIWQEVLGTRQVGATDHFLALGGNSLTATQILARVFDVFGVKLKHAEFFEHCTVAGLAALLDHRSTHPAEGLGSPEPIEAADPQALLASIEDLSDERVSSLINDMLEQEGGSPPG